MAAYLPMTEADVKRWKRLIRAAREAAARKPYSVDAFVRAGAECAKARFPDQRPEKRQPFMSLIGFAQAWPRLDAQHRIDNATPVLDLARACAVLLGDEPDPAGPPPPPAAPARARRLPYADDTEEAA